MKSIKLVFGLLALTGMQNASAADYSDVVVSHLQSIELQPQYIIDWKVGDTMNYDLSVSFMGKIGTSSRSVTKDEGATLWITEAMNMQGRQETVEAQIDKNNGAVLKMIRNGKEEKVPSDPIEIISQDYTNITVVAGTFDCLHVKAKSKSIKSLELWANGQATVMDGSLKTIVTANQLPVPITMELTSFVHGN